MKNLKLILMAVVTMMLTACLETGSTGASSSAGDGSQDPANGGGSNGNTSGSMAVTAVNKSSVSDFGGQVVLSVGSMTGTIQTVKQGTESLAFSVSGNDITVTIPSNEALGPIYLAVTDSNGNDVSFSGASNAITIVQGLTAATSLVVSPTSGNTLRDAVVDGAGSRMIYQLFDGANINFKQIDLNGNVSSFSIPGAVSINWVYSLTSGVYASWNDGSTNHTSRLNADGSLDTSFSQFPQGYSSDRIPMADDGTYIYANYFSGLNLGIARYAISNGALDTTWGTSGVVMITDSVPADDITPLIGPHQTKLHFQGGKIYGSTQARNTNATVYGRYIFVLDQATGARQIVDRSLEKARGNTFQFAGASVGQDYGLSSRQDAKTNENLVLNSDGSFLTFGGNDQINKFNADYSISTDFFSSTGLVDLSTVLDWISLDFHATDASFNTATNLTRQAQGLLFAFLPIFQHGDVQPTLGYNPNAASAIDVLDTTLLDSGNYLVVYVRQADLSNNAQAVCGMIVSPDGQPVTQSRTNEFCDSMMWSSSSADGYIPTVQLMQGTNGATHLRTGNTYSYALMTDKVWTVQFQVNE